MIGASILKTVDTFCPEDIFDSLEKYFSLVNKLDNVPKSNFSSISTRTIGTVTIADTVDSKNIKIVRNNIDLYSAHQSNGDWVVEINSLEQQEISIILHLPKNKDRLFAEFYGRKLTYRLKEFFQAKNYPINLPISLHDAQEPYYFCISDESDREKIVFLGFDSEQKTVFKSYFYPNQAIFIPINSLPLAHINQLSSCN